MLVLAALTPAQRRAPGVGIVDADKNPEDISSYQSSSNPRFAYFYVIWDAPPESSITVGHYNVDVYTGDVFSAVMQNCAGYNNKKLREIQKKVKRSLHLTDAQYRRIKTEGPMCMD